MRLLVLRYLWIILPLLSGRRGQRGRGDHRLLLSSPHQLNSLVRERESQEDREREKE